MRILITGALGQLGRALTEVFSDHDIIPTDLPEYDITDPGIVPVFTDMRPELVIHCAALTNVDGCAKNPDLAFKVNAFGTQNVAHACLRSNAEMVYISTNEVFDGTATEPYPEDAPPHPINPYGSSKRAGEQMAARYVNQLYIVRTAWLYAPGSYMFPAKIIDAADKRGELKVVTDEISNPTYVPDLAQAIAALVESHVYGIYHFTNAGYCSRFDFAREILRLSGREHIPVHPITLADYPRPSVVPPFTALANTRGPEIGIEFRPWQEALADYFRATS
ncbi:MAG: dTDP-4-dehydrorhamnose reductase [Chloroflexi bacterium]|nr:MAG: dTDP-4-dehydrorhamnose reductase [Chloroflexota bacterium]